MFKVNILGVGFFVFRSVCIMVFAFSIDEKDFDQVLDQLRNLNVNNLPSCLRTDQDGQKFEFHTGTLQDQLDHYKQEKQHTKFYIERTI